MDIDIGIPQRLCHLPVVLDILRRTGVLNVIDHAVRDDRRSKVSTSDCVSVIMCGVFLGHHDLWRMADRLAPYDMATIMKDKGFNLAEFTEERLAKALDDLFDADLDRLMTGIALQAIDQFRLGTDFLHFDTTSLSFFGAYESEDFGSMSDGSSKPPMVTYGYSKDHRPDLKQIMFGSLVTRDGGVPLYGKALDGNRSDSESAAEFFQRVRSLVRDPREVCCVADSKGWCGPVLALVQREGLRLLSRLPRHHRLHREIMAASCSFMERVERSAHKGSKEPDYYEFSGFDGLCPVKWCNSAGGVMGGCEWGWNEDEDRHVGGTWPPTRRDGSPGALRPRAVPAPARAGTVPAAGDDPVAHQAASWSARSLRTAARGSSKQRILSAFM